MGMISVSGLIGLYGGAVAGILGWWFGRQQARKKRALDEVYEYIWQKTRSYSWYITLVAIYIFFSLHLFGINLSLAMVLGILLLVHLGSWAVIGVGLSIAIHSEEPIEPNRVLIGSMIIIISIIVFTILAITSSNWLMLLIGVPICVLGLLLIISKKN